MAPHGSSSVLMTDTHVVTLMLQKGAQHLCQSPPLCFDSDLGTWHSFWVGDLTKDLYQRLDVGGGNSSHPRPHLTAFPIKRPQYWVGRRFLKEVAFQIPPLPALGLCLPLESSGLTALSPHPRQKRKGRRL